MPLPNIKDLDVTQIVVTAITTMGAGFGAIMVYLGVRKKGREDGKADVQEAVNEGFSILITEFKAERKTLHDRIAVLEAALRSAGLEVPS